METAHVHAPMKESPLRLECVTFGMWLFLASEVMFFSGFFGMYIILRFAHPELLATRELSVPLGMLNTLVLITSSFTMVLAVSGAKSGNQKALSRNLLLTAALALVFLVVKYFEYTAKFHHGLFPSTNLFYGCYYTLTGFHGLHVLLGIFVLLGIWWKGRKGRYTPEHHSPVEMAGLYWHFVDLVWIFLFPALYLL